MPQVPASPIFSLQIDPPPNPDTLAKNPITMVFELVRDHYVLICYYQIHQCYAS